MDAQSQRCSSRAQAIGQRAHQRAHTAARRRQSRSACASGPLAPDHSRSQSIGTHAVHALERRADEPFRSSPTKTSIAPRRQQFFLTIGPAAAEVIRPGSHYHSDSFSDAERPPPRAPVAEDVSTSADRQWKRRDDAKCLEPLLRHRRPATRIGGTLDETVWRRDCLDQTAAPVGCIHDLDGVPQVRQAPRCGKTRQTSANDSSSQAWNDELGHGVGR